jgi:hypothetical protein
MNVANMLRFGCYSQARIVPAGTGDKRPAVQGIAEGISVVKRTAELEGGKCLSLAKVSGDSIYR